ncbi:TetR/AcrR family transcriptional regulator [Roseinatronobacter monicus]|uniref:TetR/AcrR family transcriptional regulator n=1 Tax=Roseinatronobacter monicus TaxID=393481 RepID=UPI003F35CDF4
MENLTDLGQPQDWDATTSVDAANLPVEALCLGAGTLCSARYNDTTRERLLAAASWLFCHTGFQATGVDAIARRAGTAKTSLYKHFGNKDGLIEAVLEREGAAWRSWFFTEMGKITTEGEGRLLAMFDILEGWFADPHFFGCPFINAAGEFDIHNTRLRKIIVAHKAHLNGWVAAQAEMLDIKDSRLTVEYFTLLMDGAIVAAQISGNSDYARHAKSLAALHLKDRRRSA